MLSPRVTAGAAGLAWGRVDARKKNDPQRKRLIIRSSCACDWPAGRGAIGGDSSVREEMPCMSAGPSATGGSAERIRACHLSQQDLCGDVPHPLGFGQYTHVLHFFIPGSAAFAWLRRGGRSVGQIGRRALCRSRRGRVRGVVAEVAWSPASTGTAHSLHA